MSSQQSKKFFRELKETCKKIDSDVSSIKKNLSKDPENASELAAKSFTDMQDKIHLLKTEVNQIKLKLEPQLSHTTDFIQHFTELTTETEVSVSNLEKFLGQYGYKPLNKIQSSNVADEVSPVKEKCPSAIEQLSKTPSLIEYGIASDGYLVDHRRQLNEKRCSFDDLDIPPLVQSKNPVTDKEKSGSTPTLVIDFISPTKKETPPVPESLASTSVFPSTPTLEL